MSDAASTWARYQQIVKDPTDRHVLKEFGNFAHNDGTNAFPGIPLLMFLTGYSERTVQRSIKRLVAISALIPMDGAVALAVIGRADRTPNSYRLAMDPPVIVKGAGRGVTVTPRKRVDKVLKNSVTGCHPEQHGVSLTTSLGVTVTPDSKSSSKTILEGEASTTPVDKNERLARAKAIANGIRLPPAEGRR